MDSIYGFSIVTCETVDRFVQQLFISKWEKIEGPISIEEYLKRDLSPFEQERVKRFCPTIEVALYLDPRDDLFSGFRTNLPYFTTVFVALPHPRNPRELYVPIICEWKNGSEKISFAPPSGVPNSSEKNGLDGLYVCAVREFLEETGIEIGTVIPLCGHEGIPTSARDGSQLWFPFIGFPKDPITVVPTRLDKQEFAQAVLFPLHEWERFVLSARVNELFSIAITYLALDRLRRTV